MLPPLPTTTTIVNRYQRGRLPSEMAAELGVDAEHGAALGGGGGGSSSTVPPSTAASGWREAGGNGAHGAGGYGGEGGGASSGGARSRGASGFGLDPQQRGLRGGTPPGQAPAMVGSLESAWEQVQAQRQSHVGHQQSQARHTPAEALAGAVSMSRPDTAASHVPTLAALMSEGGGGLHGDLMAAIRSRSLATFGVVEPGTPAKQVGRGWGQGRAGVGPLCTMLSSGWQALR